MDYRKNKGYTGVDISIAIIIILIFIPTLAGIIYNIEKSDNSIVRKASALNFATEILEIAKETEYEKLSFSQSNDVTDEFVDKIISKYSLSSYETVEEENKIQFTLEDENKTSYNAVVTIENYTDSDEYSNFHDDSEEKKDVLKKVTVVVEYPISNTTNNINISTVIQNYI